MPETTAPESRRDRLWDAAAARGVPLLAILATVGVVVVTFLAGKLVYKLREIVLLMVVAGFIALLLNPVVVVLQRWKIKRRGFAVAIVTLSPCSSSLGWPPSSATPW
jgi:predicted PurR-regulated permease PerM